MLAATPATPPPPPLRPAGGGTAFTSRGDGAGAAAAARGIPTPDGRHTPGGPADGPDGSSAAGPPRFGIREWVLKAAGEAGASAAAAGGGGGGGIGSG